MEFCRRDRDHEPPQYEDRSPSYVSLAPAQERPLTPEEKRAQEATWKTQHAEDLKAPESYAREPALGLDREVRQRLSHDAPDRLHEVEERVEATRVAAAAARTATIARIQAANRIRGERTLQAVRSAVHERVPALVERYVEARRRGEIDAATAGTLPRTLAETLGQALGAGCTRPRWPERSIRCARWSEGARPRRPRRYSNVWSNAWRRSWSGGQGCRKRRCLRA